MTDQNKDEQPGERIAGGASRLLDIAGSGLSSPTVIICLVGTALIWLLLLASPSTVAWILNRLIDTSSDNDTSRSSQGVLLVLVVPFILPFIAVYSIARARHPDIEDESSIKSGMMSGYNYRTRSDTRWRIWILSGMAAALNCLLLIFVYNIR